MPRGVHVHKLTNVNQDAMTADCANCGEGTPIKYKSSGHGRKTLRCKIALDALRRNEKWSAPEGHGLRYADVERVKEGASCDICGSTGKLYVDHCHATGAIRGRLCYRHNLALGYFKDNLEHMEIAMEYLKNPPGIGELNEHHS